MKLSDKLDKVSDSLNVYLYDNGFMVEVSGRDGEGDWKTAKILCESLEQVNSIIKEASEMPRD